MRLFLFVLLFLSISRSEVLIPNQSKTGYNLLTNPGFESSKLGWTTSGTTLSVARSSPSYWENNYATFSSGSSGAWVKTDKVAIPVTYSDCMYSFSYAATNVASMTVAIEDESLNILSGTSQALTNANGYKNVKGYFACPKLDSTKKYGIRFSAIGSFGAIEADNFYLGQADTVQVGTIYDLGTFPIANYASGFGSVTNNKLNMSRIGKYLVLNGTFDAGTVTSGNPVLTLPFSIDTSSINTTAYKQSFGRAWRQLGDGSTHSLTTGGSADIDYALTYYGTANQILLVRATGSATSGGTFIVEPTNNMVGNSQTVVLENVMIPIQGWGSAESMVNSRCPSDISCENVFTARVSSAGTVSFENLDWINGNCTNANPRVCTLNSGVFTLEPVCALSGVGSGGRIATTISGTATQLNIATDPAVYDVTIVCVKAGSDFKPKQNIVGYLGTERTERVLFGGSGSRTASCSSTPCTIWSSSGGINSVTRSATGTYTATFSAGVFSDIPVCTISWNGGGTIYGTASSSSNTSVSITTFNSASSAASDGAFNLICAGPR